MITVRLMGTSEDVATIAACLDAMVEVLETSADYPNRRASTLVRRYLTCRVTDHPREIVVTRGRGHEGNCNR
jgi:hypothetical protein